MRESCRRQHDSKAAIAYPHTPEDKPDGKPEITKTTIRVPTPLWKKIRQRAIAEGISAELLVVNALKSYLKREG